MVGQNNVSHLFVAKNISRAAATGAVITKYTDLTDGEVVVTDQAGAVIDDSATSTTVFRLVGRVGTQLQFSDIIDCTKVTSYLATGASLPANQIDFVGSNGTSGSLDIDDDTTYKIGLQVNAGETHEDFATTYMKEGIYHSASSSATQWQVANGLTKSLIANFERDKDLCDVLRFGPCSTVTSIADFTGTGTIMKFTKGSKTVEFMIENADTSFVTASTGTVADADLIYVPSETQRKVTFTADACGSGAGRHYVVIGETEYNVADAGTATQNATAIAAAINAGTQAYASSSTTTVTIVLKEDTVGLIQVTSTADDSAFTQIATTVATGYGDEVGTIYEVDGAVSAAASFNLDREFQGETGYAYGGTDSGINCGVLTATNYGIKIYTLPQSFRSGFTNYNVPRFKTSAIDFGTSTTVTENQTANPGIGSYKEVGDMESQLQLNRGAIIRTMPYNISSMVDSVVDNSLYNYLTIQYKDEYTTSVLGTRLDAPKTLIIAGELHATAVTSNQMGSQTAGAEGITDTLDEVVLNGNSSLSAQQSNLVDGADL